MPNRFIKLTHVDSRPIYLNKTSFIYMKELPALETEIAVSHPFGGPPMTIRVTESIEDILKAIE